MPRLKTWSLACLLIALALLALSLFASQRALKAMGPGSLLVLDNATPAEVWLAVDDELWQLSAEGGLQRRIARADTGLPDAPVGLAWHPDGVLAHVADDPVLYLLDRQRGTLLRRLPLQWPADLAEHASRSVKLAVDARGRIAVATGGGHAVALFDANGGFLARTAPGEYRFTNGLWWQGDALWTTDTNRLQLKRLDGERLALQQTVDLPSPRSTRFLGLARAHPPAAGAADTTAWATLIRFGHDRIEGVVADILPGGQERLFLHPARLEPRDLAWLGSTLLVVDGHSRSVLRWSDDRKAMPPFGDETLQSALAEVRARQGRWAALRMASLTGAVALVVLAIALAWTAGRREEEARLARGDLSNRAQPGAAESRAAAVVASLLVPGAGQWLQRRRAAALLFFLVWAAHTLAVLVPLLWNLSGPRTEISPQRIGAVLVVQLLIALAAAWDAWAAKRR